MRHTKGPWRVYDINNDPRIVAADGFPVATAEETGVLPEWDKKLKIPHWASGPEGVSHVNRPDDEVEANAHLIAAAPELLGEHRAWAQMFGEALVLVMQGDYSKVDELAKVARIHFPHGSPELVSEAILKAEGR
jgi:hypothetical protein